VHIAGGEDYDGSTTTEIANRDCVKRWPRWVVVQWQIWVCESLSFIWL